MLFPGSIKRSEIKPQFNLAYVVVALNILIYIMANLIFPVWPSTKSTDQLQNKNFDMAVAQMYIQTLDPIEEKDVADLSLEQIATQALKDHRFWGRIETFPFSGDQVQIAKMRALITDVRKEYLSSVQYQFGLGSTQTSPWAWVTYQFTHYSFFHLLGNLVFIFLVITYLEKTIDTLTIISVYVLGGIGGGIAFLLLNLDGNLSVIGASGSLCALMAFLMVVKKNETMPWTYFFAPVPRGFGEIYLPAFLIFPIFLIADFTAVLYTPGGVTSSIAHSAHIGGTITGLVLGVGYLVHVFFRSKSAAHRVLGDHDRFNELF
ncbi:MAG: rhomboid family intramembrane serine protease [Bdellovibrio sp.]|nr:rhomboid family intramembrane serine protease [Bdellovibrio sp.]